MKFLKVVFFLFFVFLAIDAHAQSSAELKRRRDKYNEELQQLNDEYNQTVNNKKTTLKQLNILKAQINLRQDKISSINSEVRLLDNQISESNNNVHSLQNQLALLKKEYEAMILFAYHNQSAYNKLMFIFAAKDFNQAYKRLKYLQQIGAYRERQAEYIVGTEKDLHVKIEELDNNKKEKGNILKDQEKEKATLASERNDQAKVVNDLSKQEGQLKSQQKDLERKRAQIDKQIRVAIRREIEDARRKAEEQARADAAKAKAESNNNAANNNPAPAKKAITSSSTTSEVLNATPEAARLSNDFLGNRGRLPWPVASSGGVIQGFGVYYTEGIKNESDGIEVRTSPGANVRSVFDGKVKNIVDITGTYTVIVIHGEYFTAYSNLKSVSVSQGQTVSTKQILGTAATDPSTGESSVLFSLYKGTTPVDPKYWLAPF